MEALVLIKEVGAYSERQYQRQDGTTEYFKCRGVVMHRELNTAMEALEIEEILDNV